MHLLGLPASWPAQVQFRRQNVHDVLPSNVPTSQLCKISYVGIQDVADAGRTSNERLHVR
jgi:hypothetical protein